MMVGAAFLMVGAAVWLVADSFRALVETFDVLRKAAKNISENWSDIFMATGVLITSLVALAATAIFVTLPLALLSMAVVGLGYAASSIAGALQATVDVIKSFADIENVEKAIGGVELMITRMIDTVARLSWRYALAMPRMIMFSIVIGAVAMAAEAVAGAMEAFTKSIDALSDTEKVEKAVNNLTNAIYEFAFTAAILTPVLIPLMALGAAFVMIGAAAWLFAKGMQISVDAMKSIADFDGDKFTQLADNLQKFSEAMGSVGSTMVDSAFKLMPGILALGTAFLALRVALWLIPDKKMESVATGLKGMADGLDTLAGLDINVIKGKIQALSGVSGSIMSAGKELAHAGAGLESGLNTISGVVDTLDDIDFNLPTDDIKEASTALSELGVGLKNFASGASVVAAANIQGSNVADDITNVMSNVDKIIAAVDNIDFDGPGFDGVSAKLDQLEVQADRAQSVANKLDSLNNAIATAMQYKVEPANSAAAALANEIDAIEEQVARAESIQAPLEKMSSRVSLAYASAGDQAPDGSAEPITATGIASGEDSSILALLERKKHTELLKKISENQPDKKIVESAWLARLLPGETDEEKAKKAKDSRMQKAGFRPKAFG
jgi:hypothetical protein